MNETKSTKTKKLKLEKNTNFLIISAPFYEEINRKLRDGAETILKNNGIKYKHITVPGALEIPTAISLMKDQFSGFVALGCVIRGETTHYELISETVTQGLMDLMIKNDKPVIMGLLATENEEQALKRANPDQLNKGKEFAQSALEILALRNN